MYEVTMCLCLVLVCMIPLIIVVICLYFLPVCFIVRALALLPPGLGTRRWWFTLKFGTVNFARRHRRARAVYQIAATVPAGLWDARL